MITAHRATLAAFTEAEALIAVDYLQEVEVTLPEVLLAYAGTAPEFADGLPHEALWEWLRRTEYFQLSPYAGGRGPWLSLWEEVRKTVMNSLAVVMSGRDRKRRVLALFPEVWLPCPECFRFADLGARFEACRRCGCTDRKAFGTVAAPDLIPPEPS